MNHLTQPLLAAALCALPLLWGTWTGWPAHRLLLGQAAVLTPVGLLVVWPISRAFPNPDTYEIFNHLLGLDTAIAVSGFGAMLAASGLALAALAILPWAAQRFARPLGPRTLKLAAWALPIAFLTQLAISNDAMLYPARHITHARPLPFRDIELAATLAYLVALAALILLPLFALLFRRGPAKS
ncbi:MAG: hypothetical protein AAGF60_08005 [Pseudomonadota bacterium]